MVRSARAGVSRAIANRGGERVARNCVALLPKREQMPTVLRIGRYRLFFFANEGFEPRHVHVEAGGAYAKLWLKPVSFASSYGFSAKQMNEIRRLVVLHQERCMEAWDEFFSRKY